MGVVWNATNISIFNLSALEEGHYFITVLANDSNTIEYSHRTSALLLIVLCLP